MNDPLLKTMTIIVMGYFVYFSTHALKFTHAEHRISDVRTSARAAFLALFMGLAAISGVFLLLSRMGISGGSHQEFGLWNVIRQALLASLFCGPALVVMRRRRETLASAGITKRNLAGSVLLGISLSAFMFLYHVMMKQFDPGWALRPVSLSDVWALLTFLVVGISEEFAFRGYLQTRLVLWSGTIWGWGMASAFMALAHVVQRITIMGMSGPEAIVSSLSLLPISLLDGFIMLRTENVAAGAIFHAFADWSSVVYFT